MTNYFDKEDMKNIRTINQSLGSKHRSKPYDLNNNDDLHEAFKYAVCAFSDYLYYSMTLSQLTENYDESLEHYDIATWINSTTNADKADTLSMQGYNALCNADDIFSEIADKAKEHCKAMLGIVLKSKPEAQEKIVGRSYQLDDSAINNSLESIFENISELEYHYNMEEALAAFVAYVNEALQS